MIKKTLILGMALLFGTNVQAADFTLEIQIDSSIATLISSLGTRDTDTARATLHWMIETLKEAVSPIAFPDKYKAFIADLHSKAAAAGCNPWLEALLHEDEDSTISDNKDDDTDSATSRESRPFDDFESDTFTGSA